MEINYFGEELMNILINLVPIWSKNYQLNNVRISEITEMLMKLAINFS